MRGKVLKIWTFLVKRIIRYILLFSVTGIFWYFFGDLFGVLLLTFSTFFELIFSFIKELFQLDTIKADSEDEEEPTKKLNKGKEKATDNDIEDNDHINKTNESLNPVNVKESDSSNRNQSGSKLDEILDKKHNSSESYGKDFKIPTSFNSRMDSILAQMEKHMKLMEDEWGEDKEFKQTMVDARAETNRGLLKDFEERNRMKNYETIAEEYSTGHKRHLSEDDESDNKKLEKDNDNKEKDTDN